MSRYLAPALVATLDDLVIYKIEDGEQVDPKVPRSMQRHLRCQMAAAHPLMRCTGSSERFIHSEVYNAYPSVKAVVHSHALAVVPFSVSSKRLAACFHRAGFLGTRVPVWDFDTVYTENHQQDMLIRNRKLGGSLAKSLGEGSELKRPVALMPGHGMVVVAEQHRDGRLKEHRYCAERQHPAERHWSRWIDQALHPKGGERHRLYDWNGSG